MDSPLPRFRRKVSGTWSRRIAHRTESPEGSRRELGGGPREPAVNVGKVHRHARVRVGHCPRLFDVNVGLVQDRIGTVSGDEDRATRR